MNLLHILKTEIVYSWYQEMSALYFLKRDKISWNYATKENVKKRVWWL